MWVRAYVVSCTNHLDFLVSRNGHVSHRDRESIRDRYAQTRCEWSRHTLPYSICLAGHERLQDLHSSFYLHGVLLVSLFLIDEAESFLRLLVPVYAIALFTPTIINELGYSTTHAQLLSAPPFLAGCFATILVGVYSDKYQIRGPFIIGGACVSIVGYILLYCDGPAGMSYTGACLAAIGVYPTIAVDLAWAGSNAGGDLKRGVVIAMVIGLGNLGGYVMSSQIYVVRLTLS